MQGNVVFGDFQLLSEYYGQAGTTWDEGNFTYGSSTDFGDFQLLSQNFGKTSSALTGGDSPSVRPSPWPSIGHGEHQFSPDAATVTLNIAASGGHWTAYADDTTSGNAGLASFDIDVVGSGGLSITDSSNDAPEHRGYGFTEFTSDGDEGMAVSSGQNTTRSFNVLQGFGQASGS
jgi:hypothetical protein